MAKQKKKKIEISKDPQKNWENNDIQFPRLIAEIAGIDIGETAWDDLLVSMDLESDELSELFERAQKTWEDIKERT